MPFKKGESGNPKGRPVGTKNKKESLIRALFNYLLKDGVYKLEHELNNLKGKDYCDVLIKLSKLAITDDRVLMAANNELIEQLKNKKNEIKSKC